MAEIKMTKESVDEIFSSMSDLLVKKNADYGGASFDLGTTGNMVHLWDKVRRYRSLVEKQAKGENVNFESIDDTLRDIIGYGVIGLHIFKSMEVNKPVNEYFDYDDPVLVIKAPGILQYGPGRIAGKRTNFNSDEEEYKVLMEDGHEYWMKKKDFKRINSKNEPSPLFEEGEQVSYSNSYPTIVNTRYNEDKKCFEYLTTYVGYSDIWVPESFFKAVEVNFDLFIREDNSSADVVGKVIERRYDKTGKINFRIRRKGEDSFWIVPRPTQKY